MPETAENVAAEFRVSREDQDRFALRSQQRALAAQARGFLAREIVGRAGARQARRDPRLVSYRMSTRARPASKRWQNCPRRSERAARSLPAIPPESTTARVLCCWRAPRCGQALRPDARARVVGTAVAGVAPRIMGMGPRSRHPQAARATDDAARRRSISSSSTKRLPPKRSPCCAILSCRTMHRT